MKYWIRDEDDTPQRFPLKALVRSVIQRFEAERLRFCVLRAQGYGVTICGWDDLLDECERIPVEPSMLEAVSEGVEEWFYNVEIEAVADDVQIRFGLHDSTALFIDAPQEIAKEIVGVFDNVQEGESSIDVKPNV